MRDRREDWSEYIAAWRERLARQDSQKRQRVQRLRKVAQDCARCLVQEFGVSKVYLFGSLLDEELVHDRSDIDLAVEGLDGELYWKALRSLGELLPAEAGLDLVILERAWPSLAERVKTEGVLFDVTA